MLCDDCLKIPRALEPVRTGTLGTDDGFLGMFLKSSKELTEKHSSPYTDLLSERMEDLELEQKVRQETPKAHFLVPKDLYIKLKPSLKELAVSAESGCEACAFWLSWIPDEIRYASNITLGVKASSMDSSSAFFQNFDVLQLDLCHQDLESSAVGDGSEDDTSGWKDFNLRAPLFELCAAEDDPAKADDRILSRPVATYFDEPSSLLNLKSWLQDCTTSHDCENGRHQFAPARVLDLRPDACSGTIRLCEAGTNFRGRYVALSYCWGSLVNSFITTTENMSILMKAIDVESMPIVFQEAVKVTSLLNIRYLWIDALCIIQDSVLDFMSESSNMGMIYQNAHVTISASSSAAVDQSFLKPRSILPSLKMPFHSEKMKEPGHIILRHAEDKLKAGISSRNHWKQPIHNRAWTLQERFLSTRTVFFDRDQLLFECSQERRFESSLVPVDLEGRDYPDQLSTGRRGQDDFANNLSKSRLTSAWTRETLYDPNLLLYADKYAQVEFNEHWHRLLIDFGLRSMTYTSDTLIALSSIAKKFAEDLQDLYMAGIWMQDFRKGLLWNMRWYQTIIPPRVSPLFTSVVEELDEHQKPIASSGPSWSWVSRFRGPDKINFSVVASQKPIHDEFDIEFREYIAIPLSENDIFGPLKIGMLSLRGYMTGVHLIFSCRKPSGLGVSSSDGVLLLEKRTVMTDGSTATLKSCFDCFEELVPHGFKPEPGSASEAVNLQALVVSGFSTNKEKYNYNSGKRPIYYGILLKSTEFVSSNGEYVYQRVGIFSIDPKITEETFEDPIGFEIFTPTADTWIGWQIKEIDLI